MTARVFTETWLQSLLKKPAPARREDTRETGRKGFYLRWHPGGSLTFVLRYGADGKKVVSLGSYPATSLAEAHKAHADARELLQRGIDPAEERERQTRAREAAARSHRAASAITVRNLVAEWGWHFARRQRKRAREAVRLCRVNLADPWDGRPARDLTRHDAVLLLDRIVARGSEVMARRVRSLGSQLFTFAVSRDLIPNNPFVGISQPGSDEQPRQRKLIDGEIAVLWRALDEPKFKATRQVRLALKLILATAQRPGEVAGARWDEIDTAAGVWTIPGERTKNGREHKVPLSALALELLAQARELANDRPHAFPSVHAKRKRDEPMLELALSRALRNNRAKDGTVLGLPWLTPHDLRRSAASGMTALGTTRLHVAKVLNQRDRDVTGAVYDRFDYWPQKKAALETWADHLRAVIAGKAAKIVPLHKGAAA